MPLFALSTECPISLAGMSLQYSSATNTGMWTGLTVLPAVSIPAGGYFLIQEAKGTGGTTGLPSPDFVAGGTPINMSGTSGKIALLPSIAVISGACPPTGAGAPIDFVGYGNVTGSLANCAENMHPTPVTSNTTSDQRDTFGCTDTDDNAADFTVAVVAPRNGTTTKLICTN